MPRVIHGTSYTHKGWFFMCPIYLNADDGEGMAVMARSKWLDWWFDVQDLIFGVMVFIFSAVDSEYEPMYPFRVTGKLGGEESKNG